MIPLFFALAVGVVGPTLAPPLPLFAPRLYSTPVQLELLAIRSDVSLDRVIVRQRSRVVVVVIVLGRGQRSTQPAAAVTGRALWHNGDVDRATGGVRNVRRPYDTVCRFDLLFRQRSLRRSNA